MKYLLLLLVVTCTYAQEWGNVGIDKAKINGGVGSGLFNARIDILNENSWEFTSNTNNNNKCPGRDGKWTEWNCRRGDISLVEWYQKEATMKYSFDFKLEKYPSWPSPYFIIIFQDWRKQNERDSMGRHPITTIKLKNYNGLLYLGHFDNSWQWDYDFTADNNHDDSVHSFTHTTYGCRGEAPHPNDGIHHQENTCNGVHQIQLDTEYHVEIIISLTGVKFMVDGVTVTDVEYKTKSNLEWSFIKWGMYWDENYNTWNDPDLQTIYEIKNFKRWIKLKN